jgi:hypothetical protein
MFYRFLSNWSNTTHYPSIVKIEYPWHPLYGKSVPIRKRFVEKSGTYYVVELPDHTNHFIPDWMTDPASCANSEIDLPRCSLDGLFSLRQLLDAQLLSERPRSSNLKGRKESMEGASIESTQGQNLSEKSPFSGANGGMAADSKRRTRGSDSDSDSDVSGILSSKEGEPC